MTDPTDHSDLLCRLRVRMSAQDCHYAGELVDGASVLQLFGDLATEMSIRIDGDEGLFRAYELVEFLEPIHAGDFIAAEARIIAIGDSSRKFRFDAFKEISPEPQRGATAAEVLPEPVLVAFAVGTTVTPRDRQTSRSTIDAPDDPSPSGARIVRDM